MNIEDLTLSQLSELVEKKRQNKDSNSKDSPISCPVPVILFICPTKGCGNHYAATTFLPGNPTLYTVQTRRAQKGGLEKTHTRLECPDCRAAGRSVDRVPYLVIEIIELSKFKALVKKRASE